MNNRNLLRGLFLIAVSLLFGLGALQYKLGSLSKAGPGLFPLLVSCLLFLLGALTVVRSLFIASDPMDYKVRNMCIILMSMVGFVLLSQYLNMSLGIIFLVFFSSLAGKSYSVIRNLKLAGTLLVIAFLFRHFLGVNLPLY